MLIEYKNDKHLNEVSCHDRHECQYHERMDVWNGQHVSIVNQITKA